MSGAPLYSASEWNVFLRDCGVGPATASTWSRVFADTVKQGTFSAGRSDVIAFLGQILTESGHLTRMRESLNYSAGRLVQVWPSRFPSVEYAKQFEYNERLLAEKVYGGRADLGNTEPGDGFKFIGRSPIQITGRANYERIGDIIGQDLTVMPELLEQPHYALEATIAWWEDRVPDWMLGDPIKVTKRVNGGLTGLAERRHITDLAGRAFA